MYGNGDETVSFTQPHFSALWSNLYRDLTIRDEDIEYVDYNLVIGTDNLVLGSDNLTIKLRAE